eukprot:7189068-Ditylum_brightwellii.AAC.1
MAVQQNWYKRKRQANKCKLGSIHTLKHPKKAIRECDDTVEGVLCTNCNHQQPNCQQLLCLCATGRKEKNREHQLYVNESKSVELKYDGYLIIPKYNLTVNTSTGSEGIIDVHRLGAEPKLTWVMHFVVDYKRVKDVAGAAVEAQSISNHKSLVEQKLDQLE